jgi:sugar phosphate isomerase/epimerase
MRAHQPLPGADEVELLLANGSLMTTDFVERCAAAAAGGFASIGLGAREYTRLLSTGWTPDGLAAVVRDHGVRLTEIETIAGFADRSADPTSARHASRAVRERAYEMAHVFGARHVQAVGSFVGPLEPHVVDDFAVLCDEAAEHGLLVALEFVPCTNIADAGTALRIVTEAGRANGGLCVDVWHHTRGANDTALLEAIPGDRVVMIQLDDGPRVPRDPDFLTDTVHHRDLPGDGDFDLVGFLRLLWRNGARAPVSVEILSDAVHALDPRDAARRMGDATRRVVAAALADEA